MRYAFLFLLAAGAAVAYVIATDTAVPTLPVEQPPIVTGGSMAMYVGDQGVSKEFIGRVFETPAGGFVVVYDLDKEGAADDVIGMTEWLPAGRVENFVISLTRKPKNGERLLAMAYEDTNGDGSFSRRADAPLADAAGDALTMFITATKENTAVESEPVVNEEETLPIEESPLE